MNWPHVHLILSHGPIVGSAVAWLLLAGGLLRHSQDVIRAALVTLVAAGLLAFVVVQTGERAEDPVEDLPGISETRMEEHEEASEAAAIGLEALGAISLIGLALFRSPRRIPGWFVVVMLLAALAPIVLVARAAERGGFIRHPEIVEDEIF